jgi:protein-disulfide isomerase
MRQGHCANLKVMALVLASWFLIVAPGWAGQATADGTQQVVAWVGGKPITLAQLRQGQQAALMSAAYSYYLAQRRALEPVIEDDLLKQEAQKEGVSVEALIKRHVDGTIDGKIKDPSEEALRVYYLGVETKEPYEKVRDKILEHLRQLVEKKARAAYIASLRAKGDVKIALEPPKAEVEVAVGDAVIRGAAGAPVTVVEFADYQCPYCRQMEPALKRLGEDFAGKVKFAFKDFPLPNHPHAEKAAEAARCAGAQGKYWAFHDRMYAIPPADELSVPQLKTFARDEKLNTARFDQCLDSGQEAAAVNKDAAEGRDLGITGTPGFFVNGHFLSGAVGYDTLREVVERQLQLTSAVAASAPGTGVN